MRSWAHGKQGKPSGRPPRNQGGPSQVPFLSGQRRAGLPPFISGNPERAFRPASRQEHGPAEMLHPSLHRHPKIKIRSKAEGFRPNPPPNRRHPSSPPIATRKPKGGDGWRWKERASPPLKPCSPDTCVKRWRRVAVFLSFSAIGRLEPECSLSGKSHRPKIQSPPINQPEWAAPEPFQAVPKVAVP